MILAEMGREPVIFYKFVIVVIWYTLRGTDAVGTCSIVDLKKSPQNLSGSSKFVLFNGIICMAVGVLIMIWPCAMQALFLEPDFVGHETFKVR